MKKLLIILLLCASLQSHAQKITLDSLNTIIVTMQKQIAYLMLNRFTNLTANDSVKISITQTQLNALQSKVYGLKATTTIQ